ncbi:MAG: 3'-5' exonuclease [Candelina submexicana]|nr:MAG: 3'-5' exonuclease [Candelina submexicana]
MELKDLSSNWRRLQATFPAKQAAAAPTAKRKASSTNEPHNGIKKRKTSLSKPTSAGKKKNLTKMEDPKSLNSKGRPATSLALWAEENDIPAADIAEAYGVSLKSTTTQQQPPPPLPPSSSQINAGLSETAEIGKYLSLDCEMVGVGPNPVESSALARVSIVNYHGQQIYDSYVRPLEYVTDWRTAISGISPSHMRNARTFSIVQKDVAGLLEGRILVGHAVRHDLEALLLSHARRDIRDTSRSGVYRQLSAGKTPSLKRLALEVLGWEIQTGEHSSVEDARACMALFRREKEAFEREHAIRFSIRKVKVGEGEEGLKKAKKTKKKKGKK